MNFKHNNYKQIIQRRLVNSSPIFDVDCFRRSSFEMTSTFEGLVRFFAASTKNTLPIATAYIVIASEAKQSICIRSFLHFLTKRH